MQFNNVENRIREISHLRYAMQENEEAMAHFEWNSLLLLQRISRHISFIFHMHCFTAERSRFLTVIYFPFLYELSSTSLRDCMKATASCHISMCFHFLCIFQTDHILIDKYPAHQHLLHNQNMDAQAHQMEYIFYSLHTFRTDTDNCGVFPKQKERTSHNHNETRFKRRKKERGKRQRKNQNTINYKLITLGMSVFFVGFPSRIRSQSFAWMLRKVSPLVFSLLPLNEFVES